MHITMQQTQYKGMKGQCSLDKAFTFFFSQVCVTWGVENIEREVNFIVYLLYRNFLMYVDQLIS